MGEITFTYDVSDGQNPPTQQTRTAQVVEANFFDIFYGDSIPDFRQMFGVSDLITVYWDYDANGNVIASDKYRLGGSRNYSSILVNDVQSRSSGFGSNRPPDPQFIAVNVFQASNNAPINNSDPNDGTGVIFESRSYFYIGPSNPGTPRTGRTFDQDTAINMFTSLYIDIEGLAEGFPNSSNPEFKFALEQGKPITESYAYGVYYAGSTPGLPIAFFVDGLETQPVSHYYNYVTLSLERNAPPVATPKSLSFQEDDGFFQPELQTTIQIATGLLDGVQDEIAVSSDWFFSYGLARIDGIPGVQALMQNPLYENGDPSDIVLADTARADLQHLAQGATKTIVGTYTIQDDFYKTGTAPLTVTFTGVNDAPVAVADTGNGFTNAVITGSVATNDSDVDDGAILTYSLSTPVDGLTLNADGSYSLDPAHPTYQTLPSGEILAVVANYRVTDEWGAFSDSTLTLTLTGATNNAGLFTEGDDVVDLNTVDPKDYIFDAGAGNDTVILPINGLGKLFSGGAGNDTITGGNAADRINGDDGDDIINGGNGDDIINTGQGNNTANGGNGNDQIVGLGGNDTLNGNAGDDTLSGNNGNDKIDGGSGNDTLNGQGGNDTLRGGGGDDLLDGGNNNDVLVGGDGDDILTGGFGADTFRFDDRDHDNNSGVTPRDTITDFQFGIDTATFRYDGSFFAGSGITTVNNNQAKFSTVAQFNLFLGQVEAKGGTVSEQDGGVLAQVVNPTNGRTLEYLFIGAALPVVA